MSNLAVVEEVLVPETDEAKASALPDPVGFKILCALPNIEAKFTGTDLIRPGIIVDQERLATVVLFVMKLGPDAYKDKERYPSGPWCKVGDFVLVRQYSGTRMTIYGKEFRLINEDQVEAVVQDPRGISRA